MVWGSGSSDTLRTLLSELTFFSVGWVLIIPTSLEEGV